MKTSWQQNLRTENLQLIRDNEKLRFQIEEQNKRLTILQSIASAPSTLMIACEKIVEAATQLTCSANSLIDKSRRP